MAQNKHAYYTLKECLEERGKELDINNQDIVKYLCSLQEERNNLAIIIEKQYLERKNIESEIEKLTYKLCLINKSLSQRIKAKNNYDKTIQEIETNYEQLVEGSNVLKKMLEKQQNELDDLMNKKIGTGDDGAEEVKTIYARSPPTAGSTTEATEMDDCECLRKTPPPVSSATTKMARRLQPVEEPTKENGEAQRTVYEENENERRSPSARLRSGSLDKAGTSSAAKRIAGQSDQMFEPGVFGRDHDSDSLEITIGRRRLGSRSSGQVFQTDSPKNLRNVSYSSPESKNNITGEDGGNDTQYTEYSRLSDDHIEKSIILDEPPHLRPESEAKFRNKHRINSDEFRPHNYKGLGGMKSENLDTLREIEARSLEKVDHIPDQNLQEEKLRRKQHIEEETNKTLVRLSMGLHALRNKNNNQIGDKDNNVENEKKRKSDTGSIRSTNVHSKHRSPPTDLFLVPKLNDKEDGKPAPVPQKETRKSLPPKLDNDEVLEIIQQDTLEET